MFKYVILFLLLILLTSCGNRYIIKPDYVKWEHWFGSTILTPFPLYTKIYEIIITNADPSTFVSINGSYGKDAHNVFLYGNLITNADPNSFITLKDGLAKDSKHVFYYFQLIANADPSSFKIINSRYCKDKYSIYYHEDGFNDIYSLSNSDPNSFNIIENGWSKDIKQIYYYNHSFTPDDIASFKVIHLSNFYYPYARDNIAYYFGDNKIVGVDYHSFQIITNWRFPIAFDKYHVFIADNMVNGCSPKHLKRYLKGGFDGKYYYEFDFLISNDMTNRSKWIYKKRLLTDKEKLIYSTNINN
jgi:hypothetical protein